jgi:hypothetical protein
MKLLEYFNISEDVVDSLKKITFTNPKTKRKNTMLTALVDKENPYHEKAKKLAATYKISVKTEPQNDIDKKLMKKLVSAFKIGDIDTEKVKGLSGIKEPKKFKNLLKKLNKDISDDDADKIYNLWQGDTNTVKDLMDEYNFGSEEELEKAIIDSALTVKQTKKKQTKKKSGEDDIPVDNGEYDADRSYTGTDDTFNTDIDQANADDVYFTNDNDQKADELWNMATIGSKDQSTSGSNIAKFIGLTLSLLLIGGLFKGIASIFGGKNNDSGY